MEALRKIYRQLPDTKAVIRFLNPGQSPVKDHFLSVNFFRHTALLFFAFHCKAIKV
jgi:hypothetical protein